MNRETAAAELEFLCIFVSPARFYWSLLISRVEGRVEEYYYFFNLLWAIYSVSLCIFFLSEDNTVLLLLTVVVDCQFPLFSGRCLTQQRLLYQRTLHILRLLASQIVDHLSTSFPLFLLQLILNCPLWLKAATAAAANTEAELCSGQSKMKIGSNGCKLSEWVSGLFCCCCWLRALESKQASKPKQKKATIMDANSSYRRRDIVINNESSVWLIGGEQRQCCLHCGAFCLLSFLFGSVGNSAVLLFSNGKTVFLCLGIRSSASFFCSSAQL